MQHIAILLSKYVDAILEGTKTIESRFSLHKREPFGTVKTGHIIYFKRKGGAIAARAVVDRVETVDRLTPLKMKALETKYGWAIGAPASYWKGKRTAKYGTLIWLRHAEPVHAMIDPWAIVKFCPGRAWYSIAA